MPFKSGKQRRYLWANEPEIARDWTNKYGNRIQKNGGGILQLVKSGPGRPGYNGQGDTGTYGKAGQSYGDRERYTSVDVQGPPNIHGGTTRTIGPTTPKDTFKQSWTGPSRFLGLGGGYRNLNVPGDTSQGHQSRFGIGNLFRGAASMFGGIPGKVGSMLSHINPQKLRGWNEQYGRYNTQDEYEQARTNRRNTKRMDYLSDRKSRGLGYGKKAYGDLLGRGIKDPFQSAINRDLQINPETTQFARSHLQSLADKKGLTNQLSTKSPVDNYNYNNMAMMEIANNPALSRYKKPQEFAPTKFNDPWAGATVQQAKVMPKQKQQMGHDLPYLESGVYTVEDMWNNAKTWDDTGSKGFWGMGKKEAEPMTKEEFNQELKDQGYTGKGLAVKDGGRIGYGAGGLASLWPR